MGVVSTAASAPATAKEADGGVTVVATGGAAVQAAGQRLVFDGDSTAGAAAADTRSSAMAFLAQTLYSGERHARAPAGQALRRKRLNKSAGRPAPQFTASVAPVDAPAAAAAQRARKRSRR